MGSVAYAYRYKVRGQGPFAFSGRPAPAALAASFALQALALGMVSQSAPKFQIPVQLVNESSSGAAADAKNNTATTTQVKAAPAPAAGGSQWKVRCPFDFSDSKSQTGVPKGTRQQADQLAGLDRITRHPGLWSFGLLGLGNALLVPSIPTRIWLSMPAMVALIGGAHTDSRHRRGMGGELCREVDDVTSNVPFLAMIMGRQDGGVVQGPFAFSGRPAPAALAASFALQALALGMVSQSAPKFQIPVQLVNESSSGAAADAKNNTATTTQVKAAPAPAAGGSQWKVRCPFDFSDSKSQTGVPKGTRQQADQLAGLDRITRHPGLWSFGLLGLGNALLVPSIPTRIWLSMPAMVALIGGAHTDSRHRRGMGGELCREVDDVTSNVPFLAMIMGRQDGGVVQSFEALGDEVKVLNAALAAGGAALWVARRGRGGAIRPVVR